MFFKHLSNSRDLYTNILYQNWFCMQVKFHYMETIFQNYSFIYNNFLDPSSKNTQSEWFREHADSKYGKLTRRAHTCEKCKQNIHFSLLDSSTSPSPASCWIQRSYSGKVVPTANTPLRICSSTLYLLRFVYAFIEFFLHITMWMFSSYNCYDWLENSQVIRAYWNELF